MKQIAWSPTKIQRILFCPKSYYYEYIKKSQPQINGPIAMGIFLHKKAEQFYNKENLKPKYKSEDSFANAAVAQWKRFVISTNQIQGRNIEWRDESEKWQLMHIIKDTCKTFYKNYINKEPPLYIELPFDFILDGRRFNGRIDEIRSNYTIRDHKSEKNIPREVKLAYNLQFTIYALAFSCLAYSDDNFAEKCSISKEEAKTYAGNPTYLDEKITLEYHHMRTGEIFKTKRSNLHYKELCEIIDDLENRIENNEFTPNRDNCGYCLHTRICDQETAGIIVPLKINPQLLLFPIKEKQKPKKNLKFNFKKRNL